MNEWKAKTYCKQSRNGTGMLSTFKFLIFDKEWSVLRFNLGSAMYVLNLCAWVLNIWTMSLIWRGSWTWMSGVSTIFIPWYSIILLYFIVFWTTHCTVTLIAERKLLVLHIGLSSLVLFLFTAVWELWIISLIMFNKSKYF